MRAVEVPGEVVDACRMALQMGDGGATGAVCACGTWFVVLPGPIITDLGDIERQQALSRAWIDHYEARRKAESGG